MNLTELSNALTRVYNKLGNKYIIDNFFSEPFEFKVNVIYGDPYEYHKYYVDVYSVPDMQQFFTYRPEKKKDAFRADVNVIGIKFKSMIEYIDSEKKGLIGVNFMNVEK